MAQDLFQITVDGQAAQVRAGETLLTVCRRLGKDIPTLCHHESLEPYAACRVCLVEVAAGGRVSLVPSCQYPAVEGLAVRTDAEEVRQARRLVLELLLARCPGSDVVRALAARYGVTETPYPSDDPNQTCIACGLCVRVCQEKLKVEAIGFAQRGIDRQVSTPFDEASDVCIGCGACVAVCPTGHVRSVDDGPKRRMETWKTELELAPCQACGERFATARELEHIRAALPEHVPLEKLCPACRRLQMASELSKASAGSGVAEHTGSHTGKKSKG